MRKLFSKDKKAVLGLDTASAFIIGILVLAVIAFAVVVALSALNNSDVLSTGSQEANNTQSVLGNVSGGVTSLFGNASTWFSLLAVVIIILIIVLVIVAVKRIPGGAEGGL